jgi:DNA gyrase subunit A
MAKQLNLLGTGQIVPTALHLEMERSYLEYAMSVIVGRALPDARDGMKPVHRRILYAMHELGLTPDRPFRKCARVVGDVLGKYHPHGDQSVYDALVRMVQDFSCRYPLLAGHGNFGSIDNDPPAAMRYTETRLAAISHDGILNEIGEATVDFSSNFDNSQQEPVVLPVKLPILLLNGCTGIAVGMATNIPPHNLGEVVDGLVALIDNPDLPDEKLWKIIPGPDFPTGGEIIDIRGIREAYRTGRGTIPMRGVATIERVVVGKSRKRERKAIIVTELPYQVNKAAWIEKIAELVGQGKIEEIGDIRDESDRDGMRVVIELKKETNPQQILAKLYHHTALQSNFGTINLALVDNKPKELSLKELLQEFLKFREETLTRIHSHELEQAQNKLHLVSGLLAALANLDTVINILRNAPDGTTAKQRLQTSLNISEAQADSILAMPMRRLTGLEKRKLETEAEELRGRIAELQKLLDDRNELLKYLKKELRGLKKKFGDPRRTKIIDLGESLKSEEPKQKATNKRTEAEVNPSKETKKVVTTETKINTKPEREPKTTIDKPVKTEKITRKRTNNNTEDRQLTLLELPPDRPPEGGTIEVDDRGCIYWQTAEELDNNTTKSNREFVVYRETIVKQEHLIVITNHGRAFTVGIDRIPSHTQTRDKVLLNLLPKSVQTEGENIVTQFFIAPNNNNLDLILLTEQGIIKRLAIEELKELGNRGITLIKLKEHDRLRYVCFTEEDKEIAIATSGGRILRFGVTQMQLPTQGRSAQGNQAIKLRFGEDLAGCEIINSNDNLMLLSAMGYGKCLPVSNIRLGNRNDLGTIALQFSNKVDRLVMMKLVNRDDRILAISDRERKIIINVDPNKTEGKEGKGETWVKLQEDELIKLALSGNYMGF